MDEIVEKRKLLKDAIIDANRELAVELIIKWAQTHSYKLAFMNLFEPVLFELGELWYKNKLSLAQGYLAGKVVEDVFLEASKEDEFKKIIGSKGDLVIGNIEDDFHSLGRKLLVTFLKSAGWKVHDLGNDVLPEEFIEKAIQTGAKIIGVSAMMYTTAKNIKDVRALLDEKKLSGKIQLAVGGAVFKLRPELVEEFGGDGTSGNAIDALELFDQLWEDALCYEK